MDTLAHIAQNFLTEPDSKFSQEDFQRKVENIILRMKNISVSVARPGDARRERGELPAGADGRVLPLPRLPHHRRLRGVSQLGCLQKPHRHQGR